jgi:exonuclease III
MGHEDDEKVMKVKSKRKIDKLPFIIEECKEFKLDVICLQEVRRLQYGCIQRDGYLFYFSGHNLLKREGVGLLFNERFFDEIKLVKNVSSRIMWVAGIVNEISIVIFSVYAPTNVYPIAAKQKFYEELEGELKNVPNEFRSRVFIGGDFNARIGAFDKGIFDECRGKFIGGIQNENGLLLLEFCLRNGLYVSNSGFQKKKYGTWKHPRSKVAVTLDFWLINIGCRALMKNCKVNYVADVLTDHNMVEIDLFANEKKKVSGNYKVVKNKKLDYNVLRNDLDMCVTLGKEIDSMLSVIDKDADYNTFSKNVGEVCIKMLPEKVKLKEHKDWFDVRRVDVLELISQRRVARIKYLQNGFLEHLCKYKSLKSICQRKCREMRNDFWINIADNIQEMYDCNDSRGYFDALKVLYGCKKGGTQKFLLKLDGTKAVMEVDVMNRWHEHFRNLLNQEATAKGCILDYLPEKAQVIEQLDNLFTEEEVYIAFDMMKYEKAAGVDGRQIEVENFTESEFLVKAILSYYNKALNDGIVPSEWNNCYVI